MSLIKINAGLLAAVLMAGCGSIDSPPPEVSEAFYLVKHRFTPVKDAPGPDTLTYNEGYFQGDCEDFAQAAKKELEARGINAGLIVRRSTNHDGHAVAYAVVDGQTWFLSSDSIGPVRGPDPLPSFDFMGAPDFSDIDAPPMPPL